MAQRAQLAAAAAAVEAATGRKVTKTIWTLHTDFYEALGIEELPAASGALVGCTLRAASECPSPTNIYHAPPLPIH